VSPIGNSSILPQTNPELVLKEKHLTFQENQKGISYDSLFGSYLSGAKQITITDPYIRLFYQLRNFMEFLETIVRHKPDDNEVAVHLITTEDDFKSEQQRESLEKIAESCGAVGIDFTWKFDESGTIHARHIITDHGWKISLDRGLDIFQNYEMKDAFTFANRLQQFRACKAFDVTFIRQE
jgi:ATP-dependent Lon protease